MPPKLLIITVNYCCAGAILEGLDKVVLQMRQLGNAVFWIVDNKSPDNSVVVLEAAIAQRSYGDCVQVIASETNGGFGAGNNVAMRKALAMDVPPDYFYFLNPDASPNSGAINALLGFMQDNPQVGAAGGLLCNETGHIEASLFRFPSFLSEVERALSIGVVRRLLRRYILPLETPDVPTQVDWVAGTSFIVRADAIQVAGMFDEKFFLYWEEIELCHRIKTAGFPIYGVPAAVVQHSGGVSTGMHDFEKRIPVYWFASRNYFFKKTGLVSSLRLLNLATAGSLLIKRSHQFVRGHKLDNPHFVFDFIRFSVIKLKGL